MYKCLGIYGPPTVVCGTFVSKYCFRFVAFVVLFSLVYVRTDTGEGSQKPWVCLPPLCCCSRCLLWTLRGQRHNLKISERLV